MPRMLRSIPTLLVALALLLLTPARGLARETPTPEPGAGELDLEQARADAHARATASPTAANHRIDAQLAEEAGDRAAAVAAYERELAVLPDGDPARTQAKADLARVRAQMRGRVADEPASTHRAELDRRWAPAKKVGPAPVRPAAPADAPAKDDRIVTKWYFWVSIAAIAASAAAVTAFAIKASRADRPDALDRMAPAPGMRPGGIRF